MKFKQNKYLNATRYKKEGITQSFHPAFVSTPPFILESNFDYIFGAKLL